MRLVFANEAEAELERIGDYIAQDSPSRAISFVRELRNAAARLLDIPKAYPLVPRFEHAGVRRCVHGSYLIFYRVSLDQVEVIHVLHGAVDYEPILFRE